MNSKKTQIRTVVKEIKEKKRTERKKENENIDSEYTYLEKRKSFFYISYRIGTENFEETPSLTPKKAI